ncbi:MAG: hotdog fold thioesterase [Deltaproteobacteria bacterium]|nr:hotdog fold thioesterase [Deltaproteobacteria bacterium]
MEITDEILAQVRRFMSELVPFNAFLGIEVDALTSGHATLSLPFRVEFIGDSTRTPPALHGGLIATLLDTCGGAAVWSTVQPTDKVSTIDMRVDYLRPGRSERLIAEAQVIRSGNLVGVTAMRAYHPSDPTHTIAEGRGVYNIKRRGVSA